MEITKEYLRQLEVISIDVCGQNEDDVCVLEKQDKGKWEILVSEITRFDGLEVLPLRIRFEDGESAQLYASILDRKENRLIVSVPNAAENRAAALLKTLSDMEKNFERFGRRKEERIPIGKKNAAAFGLSSAQQTLLLPPSRSCQPCALVDVSVHGICVITDFSSALVKKAPFFGVSLSFSNPAQRVILRAHKVHTRLAPAGGKQFALFSCQLLEPIPFIWKTRVIDFLESRSQET